MDVMQDGIARLVVVFAVTLQNFMVPERIFERDERRIGLFPHTNEEDERLLADKSLVVVHPPHAVMQYFPFMHEVGGRVGNHADKCAPLVVFERQVLLGNRGEFLVQFLFRLSVCLCPLRGILVYSHIVPVSEIMREAILRQRHIQTEIVAGFEIVEIGVCIGVLCGDVIEEFLPLLTREKFAYGCKRIVVPQVYIAKAQAETLYALAQTLNCTIEELIQ